MKITQTLLGVSAVAGMIFVGATQLNAQREVDEGMNFTVSDSPSTTVFNLKNPSTNRHIHDLDRDASPLQHQQPRSGLRPRCGQ